MSELFDWMQGQWYQLASVLIQLGILATLFFHARKALRLIGASKAQAEPRQELLGSYSLTGQALAMEPATAHWRIGSVITRAGLGVKTWLQAPMRGGSIGPVRRLKRWLQAPAGS